MEAVLLERWFALIICRHDIIGFTIYSGSICRLADQLI
jgi:hypothetical protein